MEEACRRHGDAHAHAEAHRGVHLGIIPDGNRRWVRARGLDLSRLAAPDSPLIALLWACMRYVLRADPVDADALLLPALRDATATTPPDVAALATHMARRAQEELVSALTPERAEALTRVRALSVYGLSRDNLEKRHDGTLAMVAAILANAVRWLEEDPVRGARVGAAVRVEFVGELHLLPDVMRRDAARIEALTAGGRVPVRCALAYDPLEDCRRLLAPGDASDPAPALDPIDVVVRTGGERRTSGFFPLQTAGARWRFLTVMFPDLRAEDLADAVRGV